MTTYSNVKSVKYSIDILRLVSLRGPNIWSYRSVLETWVDIGAFEDKPSNLIPGLNTRLATWLPGLIEHHCTIGARGGFLKRLEDGTWMGHVLEHLAIELLTQVGFTSGFGKARETSQRGVYKVVIRSVNDVVTRQAMLEARDLLMAAIEDRAFDVPASIQKLKDLRDDFHLGPSTEAIVAAADDRKIPAIRLNDGNLVQLGYGSAQRRIWTAETQLTSAIAEGVSRDKDLTKRLLAQCGVPVPQGRIVHNVEDAWQAALSVGLPVVVKPLDGNHSRGVFMNLTARNQMDAAFEGAAKEGSQVMVERFVQGNEHRLLVVGGKLVAALRGEPVSIRGDGKHSVRQLIQLQINSDPRRGDMETHVLNPVLLEGAVLVELASQQLSADDVVEADRVVLVERCSNISFDCTDEVHPSIAKHVALAARIVGLDIAGIDLIVGDISQPMEAQRGAIVEVNAGPGLLCHLKPAQGQARPVGQAIVNHLFSPEENGRIPIIGVTGAGGVNATPLLATTAVSAMVHQMLISSDVTVGLANSGGIKVGERLIDSMPVGNIGAAERVLVNRIVDCAVIETTPEQLASVGLAYDRCSVGVVLGSSVSFCLPQFDLNTAGEVKHLLRTQVDVVLPSGAAVLDADDSNVASMASLCDGSVVLFSARANNAAVGLHLKAGGRAVFARNQQIVLASNAEETLLLGPSASKLLKLASDAVSAQTILAAIATGWVLGIPLERLVRRVSEYAAGFATPVASPIATEITHKVSVVKSARAI
jgi:cyanophycin synthetase